MKTNLYLFVIAAVLGIFSLLRMCNRAGNYVQEKQAMFSGFMAENASQIKLGRPDLAKWEEAKKLAKAQSQPEPEKPTFSSITELNLVDNKWVLMMDGVPMPAQQANVTALLDHIRDIPLGKTDIVADAKDSHVSYGVDEEHALHVVIGGKNGELAHLLVGRKAKSEPGGGPGSGIFLRNDKYDPVVLYDKGHWSVEVDKDTWLDKSLLTFERDKVKRLKVTGPKGTWVAERDKDDKAKWNLVEPEKFKAKSEPVDAILNYLSNLYMDGFHGPRQPQVVARCGVDASARYVITVEMDDGKAKHVLRVGQNNPEKEGQVFAVVDDLPYVVTIGKYIVETFRKTVADLKEEPKKAEPVKKPGANEAKDGVAPTTPKVPLKASPIVPKKPGTPTPKAPRKPVEVKQQAPTKEVVPAKSKTDTPKPEQSGKNK